MAKKMICPNGCNTGFIATAHVVQEWKVDSVGNFLETTDDCVEVTHKPDPDNIWNCTKCSAEGRLEDVSDEPSLAETSTDAQNTDDNPVLYQATFYLTLKRGYEVTDISEALSATIASEVDYEFPEIDFVSSCEFKQEKK